MLRSTPLTPNSDALSLLKSKGRTINPEPMRTPLVIQDHTTVEFVIRLIMRSKGGSRRGGLPPRPAMPDSTTPR